MAIKLSCGDNKYPDSSALLAGKTIDAVYNDAKNLLGIPAKTDTKVLVNSYEKDWSYTLVDGDEVEFTKKTGDKGINQ